MGKFQIHPFFSDDHSESFDWYAARSDTAANDFRVEVDRVLDAIAESPEAAPREGRFRRATLKRFPYSIFYRLEEGRVLVYAITHDHRDSKSWKRRRFPP